MADIACPTCKTPLPGSALYCPNCGGRTGAGDSRALAEPVLDVQARLARALGTKYEVRRLLGEGGFAQVYEVFDRDLQRRLAVKVLKPDIAWSTGMLDRFQQECRSIARLSHPNILAIHFVGEGEGLVYYAMPFVEGEALSAMLRRTGALSVDRALAILRPLLDALAHAHSQGLIHRDIKPDNIMLEASTGRPLLVDFGIAKRLDGEGHKTQTGFVVGTPQYMSPEQALGQGDVDARSDVYAVGAVLYQMVTGTPPFEGESSQEIVGKHLSEPAPIASAKNARIPMWLSDIIVRCLAKRPAERFQSAAMLLDALSAGTSSGMQEPVSAERVARKLQTEEATLMLKSTERPRASVASTASAARTGAKPAAVESPGHGQWPLLIFVGLAAAVAAWLLLGKSPVLVVENRLVEPIKVVLGAESYEIPAGGSVEHKVKAKGPLVAQWYLVRPAGPGGQPLGVELQGSISEPDPKGTITVEVGASGADRPVFAPLITNATDQPLAITINAGTVNAVSCDCRVNPGSSRARIGYYPLFLNSTVQASVPAGGVATFRDLGPQVDRTTGTVGLRFEAKDFPK
jgi:serine/threonine protein kinase